MPRGHGTENGWGDRKLGAPLVFILVRERIRVPL